MTLVDLQRLEDLPSNSKAQNPYFTVRLCIRFVYYTRFTMRFTLVRFDQFDTAPVTLNTSFIRVYTLSMPSIR